MEVEDEKYVNRYIRIKPRKVAKETERRIRSDIKIYQKFIGKPLAQLIEEYKLEQISYINEKNQIIEPDINMTRLADDLNEFIETQLEELKPQTIQIRELNIRTFLSTMGVKELPRKHSYNIETRIGVLSKEKIQRALHLCKNLNYEFIIKWLSSTGMRIYDFCELNIEHFIIAAGFQNIQDLLTNTNISNRIGYIEYKPHKTRNSSKIVCKVGITPEAIEAGVHYLRKRNMEVPLTLDQPLSVNKFYNRWNSQGLSHIAGNLNKKLYYEEKSVLDLKKEKGEIGEIGYQKGLENIIKFHMHGLRKYFITTVGNHCGSIRVAMIMEGHVSPIATDKNYMVVDKEVVQQQYFNLIPYLSFQDTEVHDISSKEMEKFKVMQNELEDMKSKLQKRFNSGNKEKV